jgi:hypothetical protein
MAGRKGHTEEAHETALILYSFRQTGLRRIAMAAGVLIGAGTVCRERLVFRILAHPGFLLTEEILSQLPEEELEAAARRLWIRGLSGRRNLIHAILNRPPQPPRRKRLRSYRWRDFARARAFIRRLGLADQAQWDAWRRGEMKKTRGTRPPDIPVNPNRVYRDEGWRGLRDWLGLGADWPAEPAYLPFREARRIARRLRLRNQDDWDRWIHGELPDLPRPRPEMPPCPDRAYARAWQGWTDWLGQARAGGRRGWRPFAEAREFARGLGMRSRCEWDRWAAGRDPVRPPRPRDIPSDPHLTFAGCGWQGWEDWLGPSFGPRSRHPSAGGGKAVKVRSESPGGGTRPTAGPDPVTPAAPPPAGDTPTVTPS